jgi:hypothetical protein
VNGDLLRSDYGHAFTKIKHDRVRDCVSVSPSITAIVSVALALGPWRERVVFIGGAIAPLLQTDPPFPHVRATDDVDAVATTVNYTEHAKLEEFLRDAGFKHGIALGPDQQTQHAHRWVSPTGVLFDLVPSGEHLGASGNKWDAIAVETAVRTAVDGVEIRHVSAPGFLVLKWAAYLDRGANKPMESEDIEDIVALLVSRPLILDEIAAASDEIRRFLKDRAAELIAHIDFADSLDAHLNNAENRIQVTDIARKRLQAIASTVI